jgi:hypothetical protein
MILEEIAENLSPANPQELPNGNCAGRDLAMSAETGVDNGETEANDVSCDHQALSSSAVTSRPTWYLLVLVLPLEPWPDFDFFHPNFWPIFFQPFPSLREFFGLVPGDTPWKPVSDVGGVVGGVIGPRSE